MGRTTNWLTLFLGSLLVLVLAFSAAVEAATGATFEILNGSVSGPPYPSEQTVVGLLDPSSGGSDPIGLILVSFEPTAAGPVPSLALEATGVGSPIGEVEYGLAVVGAPGSVPSGTFFDITYRFDYQNMPGLPPGFLSTVGMVEGALVDLSHFYAQCNMGGHKAGGGGTGVGRVGGKMQARGTTGGGVDLLDFHTTDLMADSFFDITYRVVVTDSVLLGQSGNTLLRMGMTVELVPEPAAAGLALLGALGMLTSRRVRRVSSHLSDQLLAV